MDLSFIKSYDLDKGGIFIIMVGPPGSGKTTIAKKLENEYDYKLALLAYESVDMGDSTTLADMCAEAGIDYEAL